MKLDVLNIGVNNLRPSLSDVRKIGMITQRFRWRLDFLKQPIAGSGIILPTDLDIRCESIDVPSYTLNTTEVRIRQWSTPKNMSSKANDINLVFVETTNGLVFDFFSAWQDAVMNVKSGKSNAKGLVTSTINLSLLDNRDQPIRLFTCFGCILKKYDRGQANTSDEAFKANITLGMDYFTETKFDAVGAISAAVGITDYFGGKVPEFIKNF